MVWSRKFFALTCCAWMMPSMLQAAISFTDIAEKLKDASGSPRLRVRVARGLEDVRISGTDLSRTLHTTNNSRRFSGKKTVRFECSKIVMAPTSGPLLLASLGSPTGLVTVRQGNDSGKFVGEIHIATSTDKRHCDVINEVDMESYLASLLSKEMNASWPIEALKAQAIAARTYALHKIYSKEVSREYGAEVPYDLESSEKHQVSGGFTDETPKTRDAARGTAGEVLVNDRGELAPVFYHAKCGGHTVLPEAVWQNRVHGYAGVDCPYCNDHGKTEWKAEITKDRLKSFANWAYKKGYLKAKRAPLAYEAVKMMNDIRETTKVRLLYGSIGVYVEKAVFRRYFGRVDLRSNNFKIFNNVDGGYSLVGSGHGHGVGLCQMGALEMAQRGFTHKQILAHYFPQMKLVKVYQ